MYSKCLKVKKHRALVTLTRLLNENNSDVDVSTNYSFYDEHERTTIQGCRYTWIKFAMLFDCDRKDSI